MANAERRVLKMVFEFNEAEHRPEGVDVLMLEQIASLPELGSKTLFLPEDKSKRRSEIMLIEALASRVARSLYWDITVEVHGDLAWVMRRMDFDAIGKHVTQLERSERRGVISFETFKILKRWKPLDDGRRSPVETETSPTGEPNGNGS